ncbi:RagB/SusD family nutrient uptake outer membrane protein [Halosquirtibacter xylanolyticus]|uniref:RagB/SusD family nutrient uptake outer membrane protein n=1 Tax=Halosquirtibacter xylanolyticus TaxID=3374599 RepID=UPI003749A153|nr:RagB/SusD family nutrient uptake outer membrane protein [Prolixibacteraceae bacterium]
MCKIYRIIIVCLFLVLGMSCSLNEKPFTASEEKLISTEEGAQSLVNGCYAKMASYNHMGASAQMLTHLGSGLFTTSKASNLKDICALKPYSTLNYVDKYWSGVYATIESCNTTIATLKKSHLDEVKIKDLYGQVYFIRSFCYFDLVRLFGRIPLRIAPSNSSNINSPMSDVSLVYDQVISDATLAKKMLKEKRMDGLPSKYAAHMLLTKVYVTLAGNKRANETPYWTKAYDEAMTIYGHYQLVHDYRTLWREETSNITSESIFEIMGNNEHTLRHYQLYTPSKGNKGKSTWGRIIPNIELYDAHAKKYPSDPRLKETFLTEWIKYVKKPTLMKTYPSFTKRNNVDKSYPFLSKYVMNNSESMGYATNMNLVLYRYSELLLTLAEIENELHGAKGAYFYVNKVLARARASSDIPSVDPKDWSDLSQDQFREAIMAEYNFELLGEGNDWYVVRRRGYEYFKNHVIDVHNNTMVYDFKKQRDVQYPEGVSTMLFPIPMIEITSNPNISIDDQNLGY